MNKESRPKAALKSHTRNNNSFKVQRARILKILQSAGSQGCTTIEFRDKYDIMHPAGRIYELREAGHDIQTSRTISKNAHGNSHKSACYVLKAVNHG